MGDVRLGRHVADRVEGSEQGGRDCAQDETWEGAQHEWEGEPNREGARVPIGVPPPRIAAVGPQAVEHRFERQTVARRCAEGVGEHDRLAAEPVAERCEGICESFAALEVRREIGNMVAQRPGGVAASGDDSRRRVKPGPNANRDDICEIGQRRQRLFATTGRSRRELQR